MAKFFIEGHNFEKNPNLFFYVKKKIRTGIEPISLTLIVSKVSVCKIIPVLHDPRVGPYTIPEKSVTDVAPA